MKASSHINPHDYDDYDDLQALETLSEAKRTKKEKRVWGAGGEEEEVGNSVDDEKMMLSCTMIRLVGLMMIPSCPEDVEKTKKVNK